MDKIIYQIADYKSNVGEVCWQQVVTRQKSGDNQLYFFQ